MLELALHSRTEPMQLEALAENQGMPLRYLAGIVGDLKRAGFIRSVRGAHGGYLLVGNPADIGLLEVVRCLEGDLATAPCESDQAVCDRYEECVMREVWAKVSGAVYAVLGAVTLQDLVDRCVEKRARLAAEV